MRVKLESGYSRCKFLELAGPRRSRSCVETAPLLCLVYSRNFIPEWDRIIPSDLNNAIITVQYSNFDKIQSFQLMNLCAPYSTSLLSVIIITNYDSNIRYDHFLLTIIIINQLCNFLFGSDFVLSFKFNAYKEIQQDIS